MICSSCKCWCSIKTLTLMWSLTEMTESLPRSLRAAHPDQLCSHMLSPLNSEGYLNSSCFTLSLHTLCPTAWYCCAAALCYPSRYFVIMLTLQCDTEPPLFFSSVAATPGQEMQRAFGILESSWIDSSSEICVQIQWSTYPVSSSNYYRSALLPH